MMKFCAVLSHHPKDVPGGAEYQAHLVCQELSERGHDCYYIAHSTNDDCTTIEGDVTLIKIDERGGYRSVIETIREIDPDVCYFRNANDLPLASLATVSSEAFIVFNISHDKQCLPIYKNMFGESNEQSLKKVFKGMRYSFFKSLLGVPDRILAQTAKQQRLLRENRGIDATVVGNGHPLPADDIRKQDPPIVLWLASLKEWKRPEYFIELADRCSDLDCEFHLVGKPVDTDVHDRVVEMSVSVGNLEYLGGCSIEESNEIIERSSVFVNTSESEGFPNTFIQSWLRKTPVVSMSSNPDGVLSEHDTGYVAPTISELEERVRYLVENSKERKSMGERAREYAEQNHSISAVVDRIESAACEPAASTPDTERT